jgi:hypothetical protein
MTKDRLIFEAIETLLDTDDDDATGSYDAARERISVAVQAAWQDGMTLEGLVESARRKLHAGSDS